MEYTRNKQVLALQRAERFSPNSVDKDLNILKKTTEALPFSTPIIISEELFAGLDNEFLKRNFDIILSMARLPEVLAKLEDLQKAGLTVVNSGHSVMLCERCTLDKIMRENSFHVPPQFGLNGYWIKRGDGAAQTKDDVLYCKDENALRLAKKKFEGRGIKKYTVSAHVQGDVVKFYGVGERFFRFFYPTDDGQTKYDSELVNGKAYHFPFSEEMLHNEVVKLAQTLQIDVYGGDAIVDKEGRFYIIDFNDWPSFSRCLDSAAGAIAHFVLANIKWDNNSYE